MKYKKGDRVVTHRFKGHGDILFIPDMEEFDGVAGTIDDVADDCYFIHNYYWIEEAVSPEIKQLEQGENVQLPEALNKFKDVPPEKIKPKLMPLPNTVIPQALRAEPQRKTLGDFMLAALTGVLANGYSNPWDHNPRDIALKATEITKQAFELYEKEDRP